MARSKVVVLGGSGFIGSGIVEGLSRNPNLEVVSHSSKSCNLLDSRDSKAIFDKVSVPFHVIMCSAILRLQNETQDIFERNVNMVENCLEVLEGKKLLSFIFLSSVDVYGLKQRPLPITENTPPEPTGPYGESKIVSEAKLKEGLNCPLAILRLPGIYGPGDQGKSVIGGLVKKIKAGTKISLTGGGIHKRDYFHVKNVADVAESLVESPRNILLNLASGTAVSIADLVKLISDAKNTKADTQTVPADNFHYDLEFDISKLKKALPKLKVISLQDGIKNYFIEAK